MSSRILGELQCRKWEARKEFQEESLDILTPFLPRTPPKGGAKIILTFFLA